ncbi:MAG: PspA/IM30 family protein [Spirochaetales bacterium]|nr:PspA/IM30 family protein [Spirochaetales bacterium]
MGIFKRVSDVFKANINDLISKAEDPEKMLNQMIIDMNEHLIDAKKGVASAIADEKRLERQMNENLQKAQEWEGKAMIALKAGKEDLAKQALLRKQEYANYHGELKPQWEAQHAAVSKLKDSLRALQQKIEEAQRKKNILIARAKRAETTKKIQQTMGSMANNNAFAVFDRMSQKVDRIEAEADALGELEDMSASSDLDKQFKELESSGTSADLLLEELKAKMDKEGGGE